MLLTVVFCNMEHPLCEMDFGRFTGTHNVQIANLKVLPADQAGFTGTPLESLSLCRNHCMNRPRGGSPRALLHKLCRMAIMAVTNPLIGFPHEPDVDAGIRMCGRSVLWLSECRRKVTQPRRTIAT